MASEDVLEVLRIDLVNPQLILYKLLQSLLLLHPLLQLLLLHFQEHKGVLLGHLVHVSKTTISDALVTPIIYCSLFYWALRLSLC